MRADAAATIGSSVAAPRRSPLREFWGYFSANKGAVAGLVFVIAIVIVAVLAPVLAPYRRTSPTTPCS